MKLRFVFVALLTIAASAASAAAQSVWYVHETATGTNTGTTWTDAFIDLQDALAAATSGDEIWVAAGMYTPSTTNAAVSFTLVDGVGLYGGFAGNETTRAQRDWTVNITTLSGDIGRDDIVGSGPSWYRGWNRVTSNSGHVIDAATVGRAAVVDGFTIAAGATGPVGTLAGTPLMYGGGIYCIGASPTIRNCTFIHNIAAFAHGGAMYVADGSPIVESCRFLENYAHLGNGAGLYITGNSTVDVRDCEFSRNIAVHASGGGHGAGLYIGTRLPATIERCLFDQNVSKYFYSIGGQEAVSGGGLLSFLSPLTVKDCVFTRNTAGAGGGAFIWGESKFINCLFADNQANTQPNDPYPEFGGYGAGLGARTFTAQVVEVRNCTVVNNHAKKYAGVFGNGVLIVENCVIWGNTATSPEFVGFFESQISKSFSKIGYSCVQFLFGPKKLGETPLEPSKRPGSIQSNPMFLAGGYTLSASSPAIDAARNAMVPVGTLTDLAGNPRFTDDPNTPDTGVGPAPIVDMGAYEFQPEIVCYADCDKSTGAGTLDIFDFLCFQNSFVAGDPYACDCDTSTGPAVCDIFDFLCFQNAFVAGCP